MTIATDQTVFDLLDAIVDRLEAGGFQDRASHIRAGYARGTGGVDIQWIADNILSQAVVERLVNGNAEKQAKHQADQDEARRKYERDIAAQYERVCFARDAQGKPFISKSIWLSGCYDEEENPDTVQQAIYNKRKNKWLLPITLFAAAGATLLVTGC